MWRALGGKVAARDNAIDHPVFQGLPGVHDVVASTSRSILSSDCPVAFERILFKISPIR